MSTTDSSVDLSAKTTSDVTYKIAATQQERAAAFRLVYHSYLQTGLGEANAYGMRVTPYHLLPTTEIFIAHCAGEAIFTMSLVCDGELGMPLESVYDEEVQRRREQGLRLGEVTCLADRRAQFRGFFPVFLRLSRLMVQYARRQGLDELLVAVHPKHARFYQRFMDFRSIGGERAYPTVRNHPAVALCLDFARIDRERPESYDTFFGRPLPDVLLRPQPMPDAQEAFFGRMIDPTFTLAPLGSADCFAKGDCPELMAHVA